MSDIRNAGPEREEDRDDALDDTFPASDPVAIGGSTGPDDAKTPDTLEENESEGHPS